MCTHLFITFPRCSRTPYAVLRLRFSSYHSLIRSYVIPDQSSHVQVEKGKGQKAFKQFESVILGLEVQFTISTSTYCMFLTFPYIVCTHGRSLGPALSMPMLSRGAEGVENLSKVLPRILRLHTAKPLWTATPQREITRAHITHLGLCTSLIGTIRRLDTHASLIRVNLTHQRAILLHRLGHAMPAGSVQRSIVGPGEAVVCVARAVFVFEDGSGFGGVDGGERGHVGVEGVGFVDGEVACVDFVHAEAGIDVVQGCERRANPADVGGVGEVTGCSVIRVVDHLLQCQWVHTGMSSASTTDQFVLMRVAEEDASNDMRREAVDDLVEQVCWIRESIGSIPAGENVA